MADKTDKKASQTQKFDRGTFIGVIGSIFGYFFSVNVIYPFVGIYIYTYPKFY